MCLISYCPHEKFFRKNYQRKSEACYNVEGYVNRTFHRLNGRKHDEKMPLDIMQLLAEHPEVTVDFTYNFEGGTYEALLNSVETDETIPWYGPLYLNDRYGVAR